MTKEKLLSLIKEKKGLAEVDLSGENLDGLNSNLKHVEKNLVIYKNDDRANSLFLVVSGEVMISNDDEIQSFGEKEYFGARFIGQNKKRNEKAIAVKPSIILEFILFENKIDERKNSSFSSDIAISRTTETDKKKQTPDIEKLSLKRNYDVPFYNSEHDGLLIVFVNIKKATLTSSKQFVNHIENAVNSGFNKIIVDLRICTLIDSTFLGALVKSLRLVVNVAGEIALVYNKENQSTLFMITYMDKVFNTFNDLEEAVNSFQ